MTEKLTIASPVDALPLSVIAMAPENPTAIIQLVHGMAEMKERYLEFMEFLVDKGYAVIIHDHRGHGESIKSADDLGYMYHAGGKGLVEDVHAITLEAKKRWPGLPLILMGHSMGSLVVRCYARRYDSELAGLIVMGSPKRNGAVGAGKILVNLIRIFKGDHHRSNFINNMAFGSFNKKIPNPQTPFDWISADRANVTAYMRSPLCGFTFTLDGFNALFDVQADAYVSTELASDPNMPVLFVSGADDPCAGGEKGFEDAVNYIKRRGYRNVQNIFYAGLRHEVLNEACKKGVYRDIEEWIRQSLAK
ncbi:MAG: alpha/beta fold hydrolase [Lachnospiraceae bacterium]|nr:alpha/beta fold hydrolase [Lachnospiraceae bacterium]